MAEGQMRALIYNPFQADAQPFPHRMRQSSHDLDRFLFTTAKIAARDKMSHDVLRAAHILRLQGQNSDAEWMEAVVRTKHPSAWNKRWTCWQDFRNDPKLTQLKAELGDEDMSFEVAAVVPEMKTTRQNNPWA